MVLWYEKYLGINFYYVRKEGKHTQRKIVCHFTKCKFGELYYAPI